MKHSDPEEHHTKFDKFTVRFYGDTAIVNGSVIALNPPGRCWRGRSLPMYWFFAMTVAGGECAGACGSARNRKTRSTRCVYSHWAIGRRDFVNRTLRHAQRYGNVHDIVFIVHVNDQRTARLRNDHVLIFVRDFDEHAVGAVF